MLNLIHDTSKEPVKTIPSTDKYTYANKLISFITLFFKE